MEYLASPWRKEYVTAPDKTPGCVFCQALAGADTPGTLVVRVAALTFAVMNLYPYNAGHLMISPRRHVGSLGDATAEEVAEMMVAARELEAVVRELYKPDGVNLGMNLGRPAGAGIADHIHLHMVPRWSGDTNFMTVLGHTRVMSEDPAASAARLREHLRS